MSCLFNSLSRFIDDERITGDTLRAIICKYLETDPVLVIDLKTVIFVETGLDVETYIRLMRNPSTFGGAIEIRAFTQIFKLNVCVKVCLMEKGSSLLMIHHTSGAYWRGREIITRRSIIEEENFDFLWLLKLLIPIPTMFVAKLIGQAVAGMPNAEVFTLSPHQEMGSPLAKSLFQHLMLSRNICCF